MIASHLFKVGALNLDDLLEPGPELGTGEPDLLPGQLVEHDGANGLQLNQGVTCRHVDFPFNCAA